MNANIINQTTGQTAYQVPGAPLPAGYVSAPVNTTMDASAISKGTTPLTIPTPVPSANPATPIIAGAQASQDAAEKQAEKDVQAANDASGLTSTQSQQSSMMDKIKSLLGMESSAQTERATGLDEQAIDKARNDTTNPNSLASINTAIADTNVKYRAAVDEAGHAPSLAGQQSLKAVADANYGRQLADLSIRQSAANGNIDQLVKTADEKLQLTLAPLQTELSYYKDFLSTNLDNLSKSEQSQVQNIISEKQNIITQKTNEQNTATTALKSASDNGVKIPDAVVQKILANPSQTYAILAQNKISLENPVDAAYKIAQTKKLLNDINASTPSGTYALGTNPAVDAWVANINSGKAKLSDVPAALKTVVSQGLATTKTATPELLTTTKTSLAELQDMVDKNKGFEASVGLPDALTHPANFGEALFTGHQGSQIPGTDAANFIAKLNQVKNDVIIPNLTLLHGLGRVTDREFQALSSAVTALAPNLSEDEFKTELKTITDRIDTLSTDTGKGSSGGAIPSGTDGTSYGFPGYVSDGTQWIKK